MPMVLVFVLIWVKSVLSQYIPSLCELRIWTRVTLPPWYILRSVIPTSERAFTAEIVGNNDGVKY